MTAEAPGLSLVHATGCHFCLEVTLVLRRAAGERGCFHDAVELLKFARSVVLDQFPE
jgi:hypothetical protein